MGVNSGLSLLKVLRILDPERLLPESEQILRQLLARDFSKNVVADMTLYPSEIFAGSLCRLMQAVSGFEADALPVFLPYAALLNLFVVLGFGAKFWRAPR
jgi:hypothetical protein